MNYLQALGEAYAGKGTATLSADLQQELNKDREGLRQDGFTLVIEPLSDISESITPIKDGGKIVRYYGKLVYAFRSANGQLYESPIKGEREVTRENAVQIGSFVFIVDAGGTITGWADDLTGNSHGVRVPSSSGDANSLKLALPWVIVATVLVVGGFYVATYLSK